MTVVGSFPTGGEFYFFGLISRPKYDIEFRLNTHRHSTRINTQQTTFRKLVRTKCLNNKFHQGAMREKAWSRLKFLIVIVKQYLVFYKLLICRVSIHTYMLVYLKSCKLNLIHFPLFDWYEIWTTTSVLMRMKRLIINNDVNLKWSPK